MMKLNKGDKVIYLSNIPYLLANGQEIFESGQELTITSDVVVQKEFFELIKEDKIEKVVEPKSPESHKNLVNKKDDKKSIDKSKNKKAK